jgi:hypothetical protein
MHELLYNKVLYSIYLLWNLELEKGYFDGKSASQKRKQKAEILANEKIKLDQNPRLSISSGRQNSSPGWLLMKKGGHPIEPRPIVY